MNMRFPSSFEALPASVQEFPRRIGRLDRRTRVIGGVVIAAALLGLLAYLAWGTGKSERARPTPLVVTTTATTQDVTVVEHTMGNVVANATVQVTAQVTGQLMRAAFQEGQIVRKGDLLFEIDPRSFQAALLQARAQLAKDTAQLVMAQSNKQRYDTLFAQKAISSQQRDEADATSKSMVATVTSDRAAVQVAQINLGYTKIYSPVDGKTGPILIQPGNLVSANGSSPLAVVTQIEPVKISFSLPQADLPRIQARDRAGTLVALLDTRQTGGSRLSAPVDFVSNQVSSQTGTIELRATFANRDHQLVPGQLVDVAVTLDNLRGATVIPREAVNDGPAGRYAYVVSPDGTAKMRPVNVLFDDGTKMAVAGVKRGETVITDGQLRVLPGAKVNVSTAKSHAKHR
jgi:multidrug efflux system membrane fusion protein